ncbi:MAG: DUF3300 domain-containing protein, partial [Nitrospirota bacterium]
RAEATEEGNLVSNQEQQVADDGGIISIDPVEPETICMPQYDPMAVYYEPPLNGFINLCVDLPIGIWLNRDFDWHGHRIHYHGWRGGGWIGRFRPHIHDRNSVYINDKYAEIGINKQVTGHNTAGYRAQISQDVQTRREHAGKAATQALQPRPAIAGNRPSAPAVNSDVYRGRDVKSIQPASVSGYGGYGTGRDAAIYSERGKASRGNMQQFSRQPASSGGRQSAPSPAGRQGGSVGGGGGGGSRHR